MIVLSIDPGVANFAYCVCESIDGGSNDPFSRMTVLFIDKIQLTTGLVRHQKTLLDGCRVITTAFDRNPLISRCSLVIIEAQMPNNPTMGKIAQHCASYAMLRLPLAQVSLVSPKIRLRVTPDLESGQKNGAGWKRVCTERVYEAIAAFPEQYAAVAAALLLHREKQDDLCDTVAQCAGWLRG